MKTKNPEVRMVIAMAVSLAIIGAPVLPAFAGDIGTQNNVTVITVKGDNVDQALQTAEKQLLEAHPGYSIDHVDTITIKVDPSDPLAVNQAISKTIAQPEPLIGSPNPKLVVECIVAAVVITVGAVVVVKLIHLCQKVLPPLPPPPPTNAPPSKNNIVLPPRLAEIKMSGTKAASVSEPVYAAWIILGQDDQMKIPVGSGNSLDIPFTLTSTGSVPSVVLGQPTWVCSSNMVPQSAFADGIVGYGLDPTQTSYSSNGIPVVGLPNIQWGGGVLTIRVGTGTVATTNVFERSPSFGSDANWTPFFTAIIIGDSANGIITDGNAPYGSAFYRIAISH